MSILIKNVLHQNRRVDVLIKDGRFEKIAPDTEAPADKLIDGSGKAIVPAFYNTHCHAAMSILRGYGDDKPLFAWLREDIWPVEARLTPDDVYVASRLAILEMIKSGTVFFADMYFYGEETMRAVKEMGIRAAVSLVEMDMFDPEQTKSKMAATECFLAADNPCPERIVKGLSCHAVYTVSSELLAFAARTAEENGLTMQIHLSETAGENAECLEKYGVTPTERLDSFGLLTPRTTLAHAVHLNRRDVEIIGERGSFLSHNPVSNLKLNSGLFAFEDLYHRLPGRRGSVRAQCRGNPGRCAGRLPAGRSEQSVYGAGLQSGVGSGLCGRQFLDCRRHLQRPAGDGRPPCRGRSGNRCRSAETGRKDY